MAKTPQKTKDATDEALTAIQEALSMRPQDTHTTLGSDDDDRTRAAAL